MIDKKRAQMSTFICSQGSMEKLCHSLHNHKILFTVLRKLVHLFFICLSSEQNIQTK